MLNKFSHSAGCPPGSETGPAGCWSYSLESMLEGKSTWRTPWGQKPGLYLWEPLSPLGILMVSRMGQSLADGQLAKAGTSSSFDFTPGKRGR